MTLASKLQDLRNRAGNPTYRQIERLIARQGRDNPMARSTIQEKISGKSHPNLAQILSIVEALAEHARLIESPLTAREVDKSHWRDLYTNALKTERAKPSTSETSKVQQKAAEPWNLEPLRQAHMNDLLDLINSSLDLPVSTWLPEVVRAILIADMSFRDFLSRAAQESPQEVVRITVSLDREFPAEEIEPWESRDPWEVSDRDQIVGGFLAQVARRHGAVSSPAIIVGLRRASLGYLVSNYVTGVAKVHPAANILRAVTHLRFATLSNDADLLLAEVGRKREPEKVLEIARYLEAHGKPGDRTKVMKGAGSDWFQLDRVATEVKKIGFRDTFTKEAIWGIPYGQHSDIADSLTKGGSIELAERVRRAENESPF